MNDVANLGFGVGRKHAGITVTTQSALAHDTVFACVRDKAESIGQLPIQLYKKGKLTKSGREHRIFTKKPNEFQTWQEFIEMYIPAMEFRGNFYALIERNSLGNIMAIVPFFNQDAVSVHADQDGRVYYNYTTNDNKPFTMYSGGDLLHIKQFSLNGYLGTSTISYGARSIGIAISQEEHLSSVMEDGALPVGVLETDQIFKDQKSIDRLKDDWRDKQGGTVNSGNTPILENGLKYKPLSLSPADSELILQRKFSREQICAMFRVPPDRVGAEKKGNANVEQSNTAYMRDALVPLITKLENNINPHLPEGTEIRVDEKGFIRGDRAAQITVLDKEFKTGAICMDEVRVGMDREPLEDGGQFHAIDTNNFFFGLPTDIPKLQEQRRQEALGAQANNQPEEDPKEEETDA